MTFLSRVLAFFPAVHGMAAIALAIASVASFARGDGLSAAVLTLVCVGVLYLIPPLLFRLHERFFPIREGFSRLDSKAGAPAYSPWWGGHQLQGLFIAFPVFESTLRIIPGAYSMWLRLWGAKVGRGIYWTPRVEIVDRSLVHIGDHVVFGHHAALCSHVIMRKRDGFRLYVKRIEVGSGCLIGAQTKLGPGVRVAENMDLPYATEGWINQSFEREPANG